MDCHVILQSTAYVLSNIFNAVAQWGRGGRGARWPSGLERWLGLATGRSRPGVRIPLRKTSLRNFGNSVYSALPVPFGGDTKSRQTLLSGVYVRGSKISHTAGKCVSCR